MSKSDTKQVFVPADEYDRLSEGPISDKIIDDPNEYSETAEKCKALGGLAVSGNGVSRISVPREVKRQRVISAFHDAFELIGGIPRLAIWADSHPTDFFKLYARTMPGEASQRAEAVEAPTIRHILPPGPLDE